MRWLAWLVACLLVLSGVLFIVATDSKPGLSRSSQVSVADLDRGKAIFDAIELRRIKVGEVRQLVLTESDLDLGLNYLTHRLAHGSASVRIALSQLNIRASLPLPGMHRFVNLELALAPDGEVLRPTRLRLGRLPLPAALSGRLLYWGVTHSSYGDELLAAQSMLDSVKLVDQTLALRFTWRGTWVAQVMRGGGGQAGARHEPSVYHVALRQTQSRNFAVLLGEAFALAQERSKSFDPVDENRAALTSLAELVMGSRVMGGQAMTRAERRKGIKLAGRVDFAQHFAVSAFLAATGGENLSDMAGLYKELKDAEGGSGFSFNDLAADRAGSRLGEIATRSRANALKLQQRLANVQDARAFFPLVHDLPEFMSQAEFQRRFGGVGQPEYRRMIAQIEARIAGLVVYRK